MKHIAEKEFILAYIKTSSIKRKKGKNIIDNSKGTQVANKQMMKCAAALVSDQEHATHTRSPFPHHQNVNIQA